MKSVKYLVLSFLAAGALFTACTNDDTYEPGVPEREDCYYVSFPADQFNSQNSGSVSMLPEDPTTITFTAVRERTDGAITVPVVVEADTDVFEVESIYFADGAAKTTFSVNFPNAELGTEYPFVLYIDDPENLYTGVYSSELTVIEFSLARVNWITVDPDNVIEYTHPYTGETTTFTGYCEYTDDIVTHFFSAPNFTYPVKVEVREDTFDPETFAGLYRIVSPYGEAYPANEEGDYIEDVFYLEIDARDPEKVFIDVQRTGMDWGYGEFYIWSLASYYQKNDDLGVEPDSFYGKIQNGAIVFPDDALLVAMADYQNGGFYTANNNGMFKLVLDHTLNVDYSLTFDSDNAENGVKPIYINLGTDLTSVKYAVYEGELLAAQVGAYANGIMDGSEEAEEITESGTINVEFASTGLYTIVAVGFVEDEAGQKVAVVTESYVFGFVADGDDKSVEMSIGIDETSARYESQGYTNENSMEFWAYGKNVQWAVYNVYKSKKIADATDEDIIADLLDEESDAVYFSTSQLASLNGNGLSFIVGDLISGTEYTVAVYAYNGYSKDLFTVSYLTAGIAPDITPLEQKWTIDDIYEIEKEELFKTWTLYCNWYKKYDDERVPLYEVTFADSDVTDEYDSDYIEVTGLTLGVIEDDTILWEYYDGFVLYIDNGMLQVDDEEYLGFLHFSSSAGKVYGGDWGLIGGLVDDGYMAFVDNETGVNIDGYGLYAYGDPEGDEVLGAYGYFYNIMLEDPALETSVAKASARRDVKLNELKSLAVNMATPANYVELRGRERAHALIDELRANNSLKSVAYTTLATEKTNVARRAELTTTFKSGISAKKLTKSLNTTATRPAVLK